MEIISADRETVVDFVRSWREPLSTPELRSRYRDVVQNHFLRHVNRHMAPPDKMYVFRNDTGQLVLMSRPEGLKEPGGFLGRISSIRGINKKQE